MLEVNDSQMIQSFISSSPYLLNQVFISTSIRLNLATYQSILGTHALSSLTPFIPRLSMALLPFTPCPTPASIVPSHIEDVSYAAPRHMVMLTVTICLIAQGQLLYTAKFK